MYKFFVSSILGIEDGTERVCRQMMMRNRDLAMDFYHKTYAEFAAGFGDCEDHVAECWSGLDYIHSLTSTYNVELTIRMVYENYEYFARYSDFHVAGPADGYRLSIGGYSGNAGDMMPHHNGRRFSARDRDQDDCSCNCAVVYGPGWPGGCHSQNLIGGRFGYEHSYAQALCWAHSSWGAGYYDGVDLVEFEVCYEGQNDLSWTEFAARFTQEALTFVFSRIFPEELDDSYDLMVVPDEVDIEDPNLPDSVLTSGIMDLDS